jgi:hypothetical protein
MGGLWAASTAKERTACLATEVLASDENIIFLPDNNKSTENGVRDNTRCKDNDDDGR